MKRLTDKSRPWEDDEFWTSAREPDDEEITDVYLRLAAIEDVLGDEYNIEIIRNLLNCKPIFDE